MMNANVPAVVAGVGVEWCCCGCGVGVGVVEGVGVDDGAGAGVTVTGVVPCALKYPVLDPLSSNSAGCSY